MMLPYERTSECRAQLEALRWVVIRHRVRTDAPGASRISYMCPEHRDERPAGWRESRVSEIKRLVHGARPTKPPRPVNTDDIEAPTHHIEMRRRAAMLWMLAQQLHEASVVGAGRIVARAAGVSPQRIHELLDRYERQIRRRQEQAADWTEPWAKRLRAAGAIP